MDIEEEILNILNNEEKIMLAENLPDEYKKEILKLEMKRLDEMIPLINKGLQEAFDQEHILIVINDKRGYIIPDEDLIPTLTLQTDTGKIIGEEIYDPEELEDLQDDPEAYFISEHFVTYPNLSIPGEKQFFVVSQLTGELECEDKLRGLVDKLVLAAPSTEADHYIKDCYDISHEDRITTLIIGFSN